ncbi:hypothetical protein [Aurantiacibacter arachoides]|nr:hypothetical protein [Aurantiacibacter arachoides]
MTDNRLCEAIDRFDRGVEEWLKRHEMRVEGRGLTLGEIMGDDAD